MARTSSRSVARLRGLARRGVEFRQREQGQGPLVRGGAGVGEGERLHRGARGIVEPARIGGEFAEQAVGGEQGERLARLGRMGERALGVLVRFRFVARLPVVLRPERLPLGLAEHRAAPRQPAVVRLQPCLRRRQVARIERERRGEALQRVRGLEFDVSRVRSPAHPAMPRAISCQAAPASPCGGEDRAERRGRAFLRRGQAGDPTGEPAGLAPAVASTAWSGSARDAARQGAADRPPARRSPSPHRRQAAPFRERSVS